eukprot:snap_masked-scaffold_12-processed-gene-7.43-mRNA-1 protein AED:1.00 eAED:1.00 QI:0/-1/0/0/-1/1/1/0/201
MNEIPLSQNEEHMALLSQWSQFHDEYVASSMLQEDLPIKALPFQPYTNSMVSSRRGEDSQVLEKHNYVKNERTHPEYLSDKLKEIDERKVIEKHFGPRRNGKRGYIKMKDVPPEEKDIVKREQDRKRKMKNKACAKRGREAKKIKNEELETRLKSVEEKYAALKRVARTSERNKTPITMKDLNPLQLTQETDAGAEALAVA